LKLNAKGPPYQEWRRRGQFYKMSTYGDCAIQFIMARLPAKTRGRDVAAEVASWYALP
jgi:hypothetical protein